MTDPPLSERALAAVEVVRRTGAESFQIRYSDDEEPVVWIAVATYHINREGRVVKHGSRRVSEAAAAIQPDEAIYRLAERIVDGGQCAHCKRPAAFNPNVANEPLGDVFCWWTWDPETNTYSQACQR